MIMSLLPGGEGNPKSCLGICGKVTKVDSITPILSVPYQGSGPLYTPPAAGHTIQITLENIVPTPDWEDEVFAIGTYGPRVQMCNLYPWSDSWFDGPQKRVSNFVGTAEGRIPLCGAVATWDNGEFISCPWLAFVSVVASSLLIDSDYVDTRVLCNRPQLIPKLTLELMYEQWDTLKLDAFFSHTEMRNELKSLLMDTLAPSAHIFDIKDRWKGIEECLLMTSGWKQMMSSKDLTRMKTHCLPSK